MNYFENKRFFFILACIFLFLFILIINAFNLSNKIDNNKLSTKENLKEEIQIEEQILKEDDELDNQQEDINLNIVKDKQVEIELNNISLNKNIYHEEDNNEDIEKILPNVEDNIELKNDNNHDNNQLSFADKLIDEKKYDLALVEYKNLINQINDQKELSVLYEKISMIYAFNKKYGSAIVYIQKSMKIDNTPAKEFMYARLLYKTGKVEQANTIINRILERDFRLDKS